VSAVGSGDAFVAGFLFARHHGEDLEGCLRLATAAGSANAMTFGAGFCSRECILSLAAQVETRRLELESQKTE
jgi:fructose-1-phosphate kinase PfkB-like protein